MRCTVAHFCKQYGTYALTKDSTQYAHTALQPFPVLLAQFYSYTLDFVTDLPPVQGFNCVFIVADLLTKLTHLIPCTIGEGKLLAAQVIELLFEYIVSFFRVPKELVHDNDPRFTAQLWYQLQYVFGTKTSASTTFHP